MIDRMMEQDELSLFHSKQNANELSNFSDILSDAGKFLN